MNLKNVLAFVVLSVVVFALGKYIYSTAEGYGYVTGLAIGTLFIVWTLGAIISGFFKRRIRGYVVFVLTAVILLFTNRTELSDAYDYQKYQAEMREAGKANFAEALAKSDTSHAVAIKSYQAISLAVNSELDKLLSATEDPALEGPFTPERITDVTSLAAANKAAAEKLKINSLILEQVDKLLRDEVQQLEVAGGHLTTSGFHKGYLIGHNRRRAIDRSLVERRVAITDQLMRIASSISELLLKRGEPLTLDENGLLQFEDQEEADDYNRLAANLQSATERADRLNADIAKEDYSRSEKFWSASSGP